MRILKSYTHPSISTPIQGKIQKLLSTRAIVLNGNNILLLFTKRYDDYSLPGGKLDLNEDIIEGFKRELNEETGALNIHNIKEYGLFDEYRPSISPNYNALHLISYCYTCNINENLGSTSLEDYEVKNGMKAQWININKAIIHNEETFRNSPKKGFSIEREIFLLKLIERELL